MYLDNIRPVADLRLVDHEGALYLIDPALPAFMFHVKQVNAPAGPPAALDGPPAAETPPAAVTPPAPAAPVQGRAKRYVPPLAPIKGE